MSSSFTFAWYSNVSRISHIQFPLRSERGELREGSIRRLRPGTRSMRGPAAHTLALLAAVSTLQMPQTSADGNFLTTKGKKRMVLLLHMCGVGVCHPRDLEKLCFKKFCEKVSFIMKGHKKEKIFAALHSCSCSMNQDSRSFLCHRDQNCDRDTHIAQTFTKLQTI